MDQAIQDHPGKTLAAALLTPMLKPGEALLSLGLVSSGIYWKGIAVIVAAVFAAFYGIYLGLYLLIVGLALLLMAYGTRTYLVLAATNQRVMVRSGIFNKDLVLLHYSQIESLEVFRTLIGGFLGYANVVITGTGNRRITIPYIENAGDFENILDQKITERDDRLEGINKA